MWLIVLRHVNNSFFGVNILYSGAFWLIIKWAEVGNKDHGHNHQGFLGFFFMNLVCPSGKGA